MFHELLFCGRGLKCRAKNKDSLKQLNNDSVPLPPLCHECSPSHKRARRSAASLHPDQSTAWPSYETSQVIRCYYRPIHFMTRIPAKWLSNGHRQLTSKRCAALLSLPGFNYKLNASENDMSDTGTWHVLSQIEAVLDGEDSKYLNL